MKTPIRYAGGKSKAYNIITEQIPKLPLPNRIISPFMGGGSLESRWSSELDIPVVGFDIFDPLVNFWNVLLADGVMTEGEKGVMVKLCVEFDIQPETINNRLQTQLA